MQFNQPLRLPSHFTKPVFAMTLRQQVLLLHQATFALERRNTSPRVPRLHTQQLTQMLIPLYICDLHFYPPGMHCGKIVVLKRREAPPGHARPGERLAGHTDASRTNSIGWKLRKFRANVYCIIHATHYYSFLMRFRRVFMCVSYAMRRPPPQLLHFNIPSRAPARSDTAQTATQPFDSHRILHHSTPLLRLSANPFQKQQDPQHADARPVLLERATLGNRFPTTRLTPLEHLDPCRRLGFTLVERQYACQSPRQPMLHSANDYGRCWP